LFDDHGNATGHPEHVLLMCVGLPAMAPLGAWLNTTESWNGSLWGRLGPEGSSYGYRTAPGSYEWKFWFTFFDGDVPLAPCQEGSWTCQQETPPPSPPVNRTNEWVTFTIVLPVKVATDGTLQAREPRWESPAESFPH